jgi:hypothetical protein
VSFRPHPKRARVDPNNPSAWATCDRCGMLGNLREMVWDREWSGTTIINRRFLLHPHCYTIPNETLRTIILPPDPEPLVNARIENYGLDEAQGVNEPGFLVTGDRKSLRTVILSSGKRHGARVILGNTVLQTSF